MTGCLAQRYREEIRREIEEVDAVIGTSAIEELPAVLDAAFAGTAQDCYHSLDERPLTDKKRILTTAWSFCLSEDCGGVR